ncbi:hypothetical protein HZB08_00440 [Candidatus Saganbacteria bacterium]|uniref:Uncharacterized protein n=1 Tax=Candidatus Saganbacteria bacterium TaxID=2575572 RepID=A0A9D6UJY5_UNCSA|nr:hypothetical protein [Candidatus Saganbacteria bacterium]
MIEKTKNKTYTVADLYAEAAKMVRAEMASLKNGPLTEDEEVKIKELGKVLSKTVLKEMRIA